MCGDTAVYRILQARWLTSYASRKVFHSQLISTWHRFLHPLIVSMSCLRLASHQLVINCFLSISSKRSAISFYALGCWMRNLSMAVLLLLLLLLDNILAKDESGKKRVFFTQFIFQQIQCIMELHVLTNGSDNESDGNRASHIKMQICRVSTENRWKMEQLMVEKKSNAFRWSSAGVFLVFMTGSDYEYTFHVK